MKPSTEWWRYLAPLAVIAIIALLPVPAGLENHTWLYFAVFTGVIVGLILEPVPGAVVAMVGISIIAILSPTELDYVCIGEIKVLIIQKILYGDHATSGGPQLSKIRSLF